MLNVKTEYLQMYFKFIETKCFFMIIKAMFKEIGFKIRIAIENKYYK